MPIRTAGLAASLTAGVSQRLHDGAGNAAILTGVALLGLTAWGACIAGLVAVLAPLWGIGLALFAVAALVIVSALILLAALQARSRRQRLRASMRQADLRRMGRAAVVAAVPGLLRNRSGTLLIVSGLVIGAVISAVLTADDKA